MEKVEMKNIGFLGAGSMTEAMIEGMISRQFVTPDRIVIMNRTNAHRLAELEEKYGVRTLQNAEMLLRHSNVLVLAMKPIDAAQALESIQPFLTDQHVIISVLAGITTSYIEGSIQTKTPIVRVMPNTSAAIGYSATAIARGEYATDEHLSFTQKLFETIGTVVQVREEKLNAITGLSGSGPAYFYYMVECMEKAAILNGIDQKTARQLIIQTITGAAKMLNETNFEASHLRERVTSPGGTTQAGLTILEKYKYEEAITACITEAGKRSEELGKHLERQNHF
ncbi:pyrroline-5-carboxylate reductase [Pseudalkalibacillus hwajinpoensis]|uniref:Pyrroline-5-carboxylate reductase n=2 Tax=Guptibacillus hwajinpoensis TaxID=208199 RepID=A0A4U1MIS3_9BACL|nr:pyrroline-5-carboxylate reductase [Pseudalkalibacillus hwajinpoensis]